MCNAVTMVQSEQCQEEDTWGPFMYYVSTCRGPRGWGVGYTIAFFSTKRQLKTTLLREGGPKRLKMCLHNI